MYIKLPRIADNILPITLLFFMGTSITFLSFIMNAKTRWLMLIVMMLYMLIQRSLIRYIDWKLLLVLSLYCAWCLFTSYWSIVPILSIIKSVLLFCIISVMVSAGVEWVKRHSMDDMLGYLRVAACFFLLSLLCGWGGGGVGRGKNVF